MVKINKAPMPITLSTATGIRSDGEIIRLKISQEGQEIYLTQEQAESLATELRRRFPKDAPLPQPDQESK